MRRRRLVGRLKADSHTTSKHVRETTPKNPTVQCSLDTELRPGVEYWLRGLLQQQLFDPRLEEWCYRQTLVARLRDARHVQATNNMYVSLVYTTHSAHAYKFLLCYSNTDFSHETQ
jgi:hypothetical protein